jgi:hypothetical protein
MLQVGGRVVAGEAILLRDGGRVRWLGDFDLLLLRQLAGRAITLGTLLNLLAAQGYEDVQAFALIRWCLKREVLTPMTRESSSG